MKEENIKASVGMAPVQEILPRTAALGDIGGNRSALLLRCAHPRWVGTDRVCTALSTGFSLFSVSVRLLPRFPFCSLSLSAVICLFL